MWTPPQNFDLFIEWRHVHIILTCPFLDINVRKIDFQVCGFSHVCRTWMGSLSVYLSTESLLIIIIIIRYISNKKQVVKGQTF